MLIFVIAKRAVQEGQYNKDIESTGNVSWLSRENNWDDSVVLEIRMRNKVVEFNTFYTRTQKLTEGLAVNFSRLPVDDHDIAYHVCDMWYLISFFYFFFYLHYCTLMAEHQVGNVSVNAQSQLYWIYVGTCLLNIVWFVIIETSVVHARLMLTAGDICTCQAPTYA